MKQLTDENRKLVEEYMWIPQAAYKKLRWFEDLSPYKEDLISEGYYAMCVASTCYSKEIKEDVFSYFFASAIGCMRKYLYDFLYPYLNTASLDQPVEENSDIYLVDTLEDTSSDFDMSTIIEDIIADYINVVTQNTKLPTKSRRSLLSEKTIKRTRYVLTMLSQGYKGVEIAISLGISKQAVNQIISRIRDVLKYSAYKDS